MSLKYPTKEFHQRLHNIIVYIGEYLPSKCHSPRIDEILIEGILEKYYLKAFNCQNHDEAFEKKKL